MSVVEPPSAPRGPVNVVGRTPDSAEIRWSAPDSTGGSALQGYVIEIREVSRSYWRRLATVGPTTTTYALRDLTPGAEYVVRILAKNEEGEGSPLMSDYITMPKSKSNLLFPNVYHVFNYCYTIMLKHRRKPGFMIGVLVSRLPRLIDFLLVLQLKLVLSAYYSLCPIKSCSLKSFQIFKLRVVGVPGPPYGYTHVLFFFHFVM